MRLQVTLHVFAMVVASVLVSRFIYGLLKKTSVSVKSVCFRTDADDMLIVGGVGRYVPFAGEGMYAIGILRGFSGVHVKVLHMGILSTDTFEGRFLEMDEFLTRSVHDGASVLSVFSVGTTHRKPALEIMRSGIAAGEFPETARILRKYQMQKFIGLTHGVRQPYVMIHDVGSDKTVCERTGSTGGRLVARTVA